MMQPNETKERGILLGTLDNYEVWVGMPQNLPSPLSFVPSIYNSPEHLSTQRLTHPFTAWLWDSTVGCTVAFLHADRQHTSACSLVQAPFGGIEFGPEVPFRALVEMLNLVEAWGRRQHLTRLTLKMPPSSYQAHSFQTLVNVYKQCNFEVAHRYTNHHLAVDAQPFESHISSAERRRLRKCRRAGFVTKLWTTPDPARVFDFLSESRKSQGYAVPLDFSTLKKLLTILGDSVLVFTVKDNQNLVSLTLAIRVNPTIMYNFCPADDLRYRSYSPTVLLNAALYEYAQQEGIRLIDLGVSIDHFGNEKPSLIRFKENLGGKRSIKLTYEKEFL